MVPRESASAFGILRIVANQVGNKHDDHHVTSENRLTWVRLGVGREDEERVLTYFAK